MSMAPSAAQTLDARPVRPTADTTLWDEAVARRDQIAQRIRDTLTARGVEALVFVSEPGNYPPWARLESWMPVDAVFWQPIGSRQRSILNFIVDVQPYRRAQIVVTARLNRGSREIVAENRADFSLEDVAEWTNCALSPKTKPRNVSFFDKFFFWRNDNPIARPFKSQLMDRLKANWQSLLLVAAALLLWVIGLALSNSWLFLLGLAALLFSFYVVGRSNRHRAQSVYVPEQPVFAPRQIGLVDSWHAVIAGLGQNFTETRERLLSRLKEEEGKAGIACRTETYGYRTPNGFEQRQRFVISKGQAIVYLHTYAFGADMFIGWNAYLNWMQWAETAAVSSRVEPSGNVEFRELRGGFYRPTHLDIVDLNSLSELVHRHIERELKAIMKEKEIDQEIDFKIIRGDRDTALDESRHGSDGSAKEKRRGATYVATES